MRKNAPVKKLVTPNSDRTHLGLWLEACDHWITSDHILQSRIREDFLLIYCVNGSGTYRAGSRNFHITKGDVFTAIPHIEHGYHCHDNGWEIWFVHFGGDQAERLLNWIGFSISQLVIRLGTSQNVIKTFDNLHGISQKKSMHYDIDASAGIYNLLLTLKKSIRQKSTNKGMLEQVIEGNCRSLEEMAKKANMSKYHFIRKFQAATGQTPWQYINRRRILQAKELLTQKDLSIKQIANRLGFNDPNYFSRLFKSQTGVTASRYRDLIPG